MTAREITEALDGRWSGTSGTARCPAHDDHNPSLSITERDGKVLVHCFAGCPQAAVLNSLTRMGLIAGADTRRHPDTPIRQSRRDPDANQKVFDAKRIWAESVPAAGTPVQLYLACRGIWLPVPETIRYHPAINALIAAVEDRNGEIIGLQRVYLEQDAAGVWKRGRYSLGKIAGGAVRLTPPAKRLQLAESVEDALALMQITGRATWAVPGAGLMEKFEPPPECETVVLAPDNDEAGQKAIEKAARALMARGVKVEVLLPPTKGADWVETLERWDERSAIITESCGIDADDAELRAWTLML